MSHQVIDIKYLIVGWGRLLELSMRLMPLYWCIEGRLAISVGLGLRSSFVVAVWMKHLALPPVCGIRRGAFG